MALLQTLIICLAVALPLIAAECSNCKQTCKCLNKKTKALNKLATPDKLKVLSDCVDKCEVKVSKELFGDEDATVLRDEPISDSQWNALEKCVEKEAEGCSCVQKMIDTYFPEDKRVKRSSLSSLSSVRSKRDATEDEFTKKMEACLKADPKFVKLNLNKSALNKIRKSMEDMEDCADRCWDKAEEDCEKKLNIKFDD